MNNPVYIATAFDNQVRFYFADTTQITNTIINQAPISPMSLICLTNTIGITGIMGLMEKQEVKICSIVNGDGEAGKIYAQADQKGHVRGIISNRFCEANTISQAVGTIGNIELTIDNKMRQPYTSQTSIVKGDIFTDFSYYYVYSQQTPTAISGGVNFNEQGEVHNSAILLVQALPDTDETILEELTNNLTKYNNISQLMNQKSVEDICRDLFGSYQLLDTKDLIYSCDCSYDKCVSNINLLNPEERLELINSKEAIEVVCDWCLKKYIIDKKDINKG